MLEVTIDHEQRRVKIPQIPSLVDGRSWDILEGLSDTFVDDITKTLMIKPYCLMDDWATNTSGSYARMGIADYQTLAASPISASDWVENNRRVAGDIYLEPTVTGTPGAVYTEVSYLNNKPWYLSLYIPEARGGAEQVLECGWGDVNVVGTVGLRIYGSGKCQVYKFFATGVASLLGEYTLSGQRQQDGTRAPATSARIDGQWLDLQLIPCRRNALLVLSSAGQGFCHVFKDLDPEVVNTITPEGRFWWHITSGHMAVQLAPMLFPTTGYALRLPDELPQAPAIGATYSGAPSWDEAGYGSQSVSVSLRKSDGTTCTPDGVIDTVRIRVDLTGDTYSTPFFYGTDLTFDPVVANTDDSEEEDIAASVLRVSFRVPDSLQGVGGTIYAVETAPLADITGHTLQSARPVRLRIDSDASATKRNLIEGRLSEPVVEEVQREIEPAQGGVARGMTFDFVDGWDAIEASRFDRDGTPLDGFAFDEALESLLVGAGVDPAEIDIEATAFYVPITPAVAAGEWNWQPKAGDTRGQWVRRLLDELAPTWIAGFRPTLTGRSFKAGSPSHYGTTATATLWLSDGGDDSREPVKAFNERNLPPEATRITVYGYDAATRTILRSRWVDATLEDPTTVPSARPDGWRGEVEPLVVVESRLTTEDSVVRAQEELATRVGVSERHAELEAPLITASNGVPLWRGDVFEVKSAQSGRDRGRYRIRSFSGDLRRDSGIGGYKTRRVQYVAVRIGDIIP